MNYGIYMWDAAADAFRMDATLCQYFGLAKSVGFEGISLSRVVALLHSSDRAGFSYAIEASAREGSSFSHEFRLAASNARMGKLQAIGHSFPGQHRAAGVCTGLVFQIKTGSSSHESDLTEHCIAAYEFAKKSNSGMVQYLISMALIELGYEIAGFEPGTMQ